MRVFDYLFYKLFRAAERSSVPEGAGAIANFTLSLLIYLNIFSIWGFLRKIEVMELNLFPNKIIVAIEATVIFIMFALYFFVNGRYRRILETFKKESPAKRVRGNIIVITYVVITFLIILILPQFKPGIT